jgi:hypothetical protein
VPKADNFTAICEQLVQKMWEPEHLTTLRASMACYRNSFTLLIYIYIKDDILDLGKSKLCSQYIIFQGIIHTHFYKMLS